MRHAHTRATALPSDLVEAQARANSACEKIWREARRTSDFFDMIFDVEVADAKHLTNILAAMRTSKAVKEVERVKG